MSAPFWEDEPEAYDVVDIAGHRFHVANVGGDCGIKMDVKTAPGVDGTTIKYQGVEPAKVTLTLLLWQEEHLRAFEALIRLIRPKAAKAPPSPVEIVHPLLELYGLRQFYVERPSLPTRAAGGHFEVTLGCVEWFSAPKAAKAAKPRVGTTTVNGVPAGGVSTYYTPPAGTPGGPPLPPSSAYSLSQKMKYGGGA